MAARAQEEAEMPPQKLVPDIHLPALVSVGACFTISVIYVASLYVWKSRHDRDHPFTIKRRFFSVFVVMLIAPLFVLLLSCDAVFQKYTMWEIMGFRLEGLLTAICLPLLLTSILFLGPLSVTLTNGVWRIYSEPMYWVNAVQNLMWLRNHLVAPLSEEFTFRACMLPLLLQTFRPHVAMLITPLLFGLAHLHHIKERLRDGTPMKTVLTVSFFQFFYTTIFGIYSAYLFVRSGHFAAAFVAHAFCNHMGFPDIQEVLNQTHHRKIIFFGLYLLGLVGWILLLPAVTTPSWYANHLFWADDV
ncbi:CAAX prenyl protease 2 [Topomyia yanbarensis]|uniref:CAAX prenyl protease 2 n=1 Tax=Topomyia yanbarensis TaxID=2498891 RepID=UPI00273A8D99|nr:CAAX prenyl protease 2 [Topomyia yanbarensis]XP_058811820.1 CAAX prenyl protease 2 [Topomyia yanbarensis]